MSFKVSISKPVMRFIVYSMVVTLLLGIVYGYLQSNSQETNVGQLAPEPLLSPSIATAISAVAGSNNEPPQHPVGAAMMSVDSTRSAILIAESAGGGRIIYRRWVPANGESSQVPIPPEISNFLPSNILDVRAGAIFLGQRKGSDDQIVVLISPQNKIRSAKLNIKRETPYLLELNDGSVLVIGGIVGYIGNQKKFTNTVERIAFASNTFSSSNEALSVEQMPDIPGETRRGSSFVELPDNRLMALGGSMSQYVGSEPITSETHILDLTKKIWQPGPKMIEARANATATLLPDGNVLVAGGWTQKNTWNDTPARTVELWDQHSNSFVSGNPLPMGVANHQAMWMSYDQGKQLILVGGWVKAWSGNQFVLALDSGSNSWRSVGEQCQSGHKTGELMAAPFEYNGHAYIWCQTPTSAWNLVPLRLSSMSATNLPQIDHDKGIALHRYGVAFLPPIDNLPGLAAGGSVEGADSAAVDAIWLDGRTQGIAPLNHARRNATVLRMNDGSFLVAGGKGGDSTRRTLLVPPFELLPASVPFEQAHWIDIGFDSKDIIGISLLGDGSLFVVYSTGNVERLVITFSNNKISVQRFTLPPLKRKRFTWNENEGEISVKELPDGRIIVAGGTVQYHQMALLNEETSRPDAPDQYVGIGEYQPAHWYEIYNPVTKNWNESVSSEADSTTTAILDDGRVVKWGKIGPVDPWAQEHNNTVEKPKFEISSSDAKQWIPLKEQAVPLVATDTIHRAPELYVIQGELFIFGVHLTEVTKYYARGNAMVQWFNTSNASWETLWESKPDDNWNRDHIGRIIIRVLPNGKRIALQIAGLSGKGNP